MRPPVRNQNYRIEFRTGKGWMAADSLSIAQFPGVASNEQILGVFGSFELACNGLANWRDMHPGAVGRIVPDPGTGTTFPCGLLVFGRVWCKYCHREHHG